MSPNERIQKSYDLACQQYAELGVDVAQALQQLAAISISLHCWQGDDVTGFENISNAASAGFQATGNYPGKARNIHELRQDLELALGLIPGVLRVNLHASYLDNQGKRVDRNEITLTHFQSWIDWARQRKLGLDFNPTFFAHPLADDGFTLSHRNPTIRRFWVDHAIACRRIAEGIGRQLGTPCITNFWLPDGYKDIPADRLGPRQRLAESLDTIFVEKTDCSAQRDSLESKLFGIGSESYVVGSHEFYFGYAVAHKKILTFDMGHFHPTESIADKISSSLLFLDEILLHVSRPVRWDSDHVVIFNDDLLVLAEEIIGHNFLGRVHLALDYFDASIHRLGAWAVGARALRKALLRALLLPLQKLRQFEADGDHTSRLAFREGFNTLPLGAVWDYFCASTGVPLDLQLLDPIKKYESEITLKRI